MPLALGCRNWSEGLIFDCMLDEIVQVEVSKSSAKTCTVGCHTTGIVGMGKAKQEKRS